jgi:hypothetical protein
MDYKDAPEVREIAADLVAEHHKHLEAVRIAFAFTDKAGKKSGKTALEKVSIESGKTVWFAAGAPDVYHGGKFFLLAFPEFEWECLKDDQKRALVDHALSHCGKDPESGDLCLWPHDIEEFSAVVERHGLWIDDLREFVEAATAEREPELPFGDSESKVVRSFDDDDAPESQRFSRIAALKSYHERYLDDPNIDPDDGALERLSRETAERIEALETGVGYVPADDCALLGRWRVVYPKMPTIGGIPTAALVEAVGRRMPGAAYSVKNGVPTITVPAEG